MNMGAQEATPEPSAPPFYRGCFVRYTEPPHVREWRQYQENKRGELAVGQNAPVPSC